MRTNRCTASALLALAITPFAALSVRAQTSPTQTGAALSTQVPTAGNTAPALTPIPAVHASSTFQPAIARVTQAVADAQVEKWKGSGSIRQDAQANLSSIARDIQGTLPDLMAKADAVPGTLAAPLAVQHNIGALYDVLLRVVESAKLNAPRNQAAELEQALQSLEDSRRDFSEQIQATAAAQERHIADLNTQLRLRASAPAPVCPPPPEKPVHKKHHTTKKPSAAATTPQQGAPPKQP